MMMSTRWKSRASVASLLAFAALAGGCDESVALEAVWEEAAQAAVTTSGFFDVTPDSLHLVQIGTMRRLKGSMVDGAGSETAVTPTFSSRNPGIVSVNSKGWMKARSGGRALVIATYGTARDTAVVTVGPVATGTIQFTVAEDSIAAVGGKVKLIVDVRTPAGVAIADPLPKWSTLTPAIVSVAGINDATVTARSLGKGLVVAQRGALADTATVWVGPKPTSSGLVLNHDELLFDQVGGMASLKGTYADASGTMAVKPSFSSSNTSVAIVYRDGWMKATGAGKALIVGSHHGSVDSLRVQVGGIQTGALRITNDVDSIPAAGATVRLIAEATDPRGIDIRNPKVHWNSLNPEVATVSGSSHAGDVTAMSGGVAKIVAMRGPVADTATVSVGGVAVQKPPVARSVLVNPAADTIARLGASVQLTAIVLDAQKNAMTGQTLIWTTLDPSVASVSGSGLVTAAARGSAKIRATLGALSDTALVVVQPQHGGGGGVGSPMPANLKATVGALMARPGSQQQPMSGYDGRYAAAELATYDKWVAGGRSIVDGSWHYGALRSRYQWSVRNGLPVGPPASASSVYGHGVEMTRSYLTKYSVPNSFKVAPHNNTAMADVEMLYLLEGDADALAHLKGIAHMYGAAYGEYYFDLTGSNSDPRSSAILLQTLSVAARLGFPYTARASWGSTWKEAATAMVGRMDAQIPADGKVVSLAHKNTGQGDEAFFMNAMLAVELLRWHGFVEPQPTWVALATRIMDHLVDEHNRRGAACLPYLSKGRGCASDLAGFYVWPALVLWQETGDAKYRTFALDNLQAVRNAFISQTKIFNQAYSTGAQSAEALLAGVSWR